MLSNSLASTSCFVFLVTINISLMFVVFRQSFLPSGLIYWLAFISNIVRPFLIA